VRIGRVVLRTVVGGLMVGHGLQKLVGWFDGPGLSGTEQAMAAMDLYPAPQQARLAATSETVGGGLTALGLLNPLGPAMIIGVMAVAIHKVHGKNGLWLTGGGYEYNLTLIAAAAALAAEGGGLDALFGADRHGVRWALAALAVGGAAAAATVSVAERLRPPPEVTPASDTLIGNDDAGAVGAPGRPEPA
jgi:putative oxidoreductase